MTNGQPNPLLQGGVQANVNGQNLVSQLLGLNEEQGASGSFGGGDGRIQGASPQRSSFVSTARRLKLSDAFHGINITHNFLFLCLFLGFTGWLFVVYWVRHHEPLANDVLGVGAASRSKMAEADRRLVAQIKRTLPVRTSNETGDFYVPIPRGNGVIGASGDYGSESYSGAGAAFGTPQSVMPLPQPPLPAPPTPTPPTPTPLSYYSQYAPSQPTLQPQANAYFMPTSNAAAPRLRTFVNR